MISDKFKITGDMRIKIACYVAAIHIFNRNGLWLINCSRKQKVLLFFQIHCSVNTCIIKYASCQWFVELIFWDFLRSDIGIYHCHFVLFVWLSISVHVKGGGLRKIWIVIGVIMSLFAFNLLNLHVLFLSLCRYCPIIRMKYGQFSFPTMESIWHHHQVIARPSYGRYMLYLSFFQYFFGVTWTMYTADFLLFVCMHILTKRMWASPWVLMYSS